MTQSGRTLISLFIIAMMIALFVGAITFAAAAGLFIAAMVAIYAIRHARMWKGVRPHGRPLIHIDAHMGVRPTALKHVLPDGYRLACLYFGTGLIDRTNTLDQGYPYQVIDRIPELREPPGDFAMLCDRRAQQIVSEARRRRLPIHLLWSGGIDSTTAAIALIRALDGETERLRVFLNAASQREYRQFFKQHLRKQFEIVKFGTISKAFEGDAIVVTGELGDQLFGSAKAMAVPARSFWQPKAEPFPGPLRQPWQDALPNELHRVLASSARAETVMHYLAPHIARAPVAIPDLFTCLWWLNYSLKWQAVTLRMMPASGAQTLADFDRKTSHFFRTQDFELWALKHAGQGIRDSWNTYKWPARDYIHAFTGDDVYRSEKQKQPSLRGLMPPPMTSAALAIDHSGAIHFQPRDESLRKLSSVDEGSGFGIEITTSRVSSKEFSASREAQLWDDLGDGE